MAAITRIQAARTHDLFRMREHSTTRSSQKPMIYCRRMQECSGELHPRARQGLQLFNQGRYFEAHEELEAAWRAEPGRIRELYQGILEAGVTYLHLRRGNLAGAEKVCRRSMRWLRQWPEVCRGADVGQLRRDLETAVEEARRLGEGRLGELPESYFRPVVWRTGNGDEPDDSS